MKISAEDQEVIDLLKRVALQGAEAFVAIYPDNVSKLSRDAAYFRDPCEGLISSALDAKSYEEATLYLRAYADHGVAVALPNAIALSKIAARALELAIEAEDEEVFALATTKLNPGEEAEFDFLFKIACWYAMRSERPQMLKAIVRVLDSYDVGPSTFTKESSFSAFKKDPDFKLAIRGNYKLKK